MSAKLMKFLGILVLFLSSYSLFAAIPSGYYDSLEGKTGAELKTAAFNVIKVNILPNGQYNKLQEYFYQTDVGIDPNTGQKIWLDMYSYYIVSAEGDDGFGSTYPDTGNGHPDRLDNAESCYEKEHCMPKSWYGDKEANKKAYNDMHNLYPSNGFANNKKSNYPLGEVETATFDNGCCKVGTSFQNYGGGIKVFEPADEYKGDFARTYLYMATCYEDAAWQGTECMQMMDGTTYPTFQPWAIDMLLEWCRQDPVSEKEIMRNDKVYEIQQNRNPYIDHPELAEYVWGDKNGIAWYPGQVVDVIAPPVITPNGGDFEQGYAITVSISAEETSHIRYTLDGSEPNLNSPIYRGPLNISSPTTVKAIATENGEVSIVKTAKFTFNGEHAVVPGPISEGTSVFQKVTDVSQLVNGEQYILVGNESDFAMGSQNTKFRDNVAITKNLNRVEVDLSTSGVAVFILEKKGNYYALKDNNGSGYLANNGNKNSLYTVSPYTSVCDVKITIGGDIEFINEATYKYLRYNKSNPRFACYASNTTVKETVNLYCKVVLTDLSPITATAYTKHPDFSYTANWNAAPADENIDFYVITRKVIIDGVEHVYKYKTTETSFHMSRVSVQSYERYSVQSSRSGVLSPVSNEILIDAVTSVDKVDKPADNITVTGDYGKINFICNEELSGCHIYSMSGTLVKVIDKIYENSSVELSRGFYLVVLNDKTAIFKVIVR